MFESSRIVQFEPGAIRIHIHIPIHTDTTLMEWFLKALWGTTNYGKHLFGAHLPENLTVLPKAPVGLQTCTHTCMHAYTYTHMHAAACMHMAPCGSLAGRSLESVIEEFGIKRILLIHPKWIDEILHNGKRVELRSRPVKIRGPIGIGWHGKLYGTAELSDCISIDDEWKRKNVHLHKVTDFQVTAKYDYGWVLGKVVALDSHVTFCQPNGCQMWVKPTSVDSQGSTDSLPADNPAAPAESEISAVSEHVYVLRLVPHT